MAKKSIEAVEEKGGFSAESLKQLLMKKTPGIFDREPAPSFNGNLDKLVEEIISLK